MSLSRSTRIMIGGGVMAYAAIALYLSDASEKPLGLDATDDDWKRLKSNIPSLETVEKSKRDG